MSIRHSLGTVSPNLSQRARASIVKVATKKPSTRALRGYLVSKGLSTIYHYILRTYNYKI